MGALPPIFLVKIKKKNLLKKSIFLDMDNQVSEQLFPSNTRYLDEAPGYVTEWSDKSCCCCKIAHFNVGDFSIIGHWKTSFTKLFIVCILFIASYMCAMLRYLFSGSGAQHLSRTDCHLFFFCSSDNRNFP